MVITRTNTSQLQALAQAFLATPEHEAAEAIVLEVLRMRSAAAIDTADTLVMSSGGTNSGAAAATLAAPPPTSVEQRARPVGTLAAHEVMLLNRARAAAPSPALDLQDGMRLPHDQALDAALAFLGPSYSHKGAGRFVSADGTRQLRMGDGDVLGKHGGGRHFNLEVLEPNPSKPGRMRVVQNLHLFLEP